MGFFGLFASRKEVAERNKQIRKAEKQAEAAYKKQIRAAEAERIKQIRMAEKQEETERKKQIRDEQRRKKIAAKPAERLSNAINKLIQEVQYELNGIIKRSKLEMARRKITELKEYAKQYQFLKLYDLEKTESKIEEMYEDAVRKCTLQNDQKYKKKISDLDKLTKTAVKLSLNKQCQTLNLPFEAINSDCFSKPEIFAYEYYKSLGYSGAYCEGGAILTALKALCLDKLAELHLITDKHVKTPSDARARACNIWFESHCVIFTDKSEIILDAIRSTNRPTFIKNFTDIYTPQSLSHRYYKGLTLELMANLYDGVDTEIFHDIAKVILDDPSYRAGWPDLTLIRGTELRFVEVKTSDTLLENQIKTIQTMREILPDAFSVVKVVKKK